MLNFVNVMKDNDEVNKPKSNFKVKKEKIDVTHEKHGKFSSEKGTPSIL